MENMTSTEADPKIKVVEDGEMCSEQETKVAEDMESLTISEHRKESSHQNILNLSNTNLQNLSEKFEEWTKFCPSPPTPSDTNLKVLSRNENFLQVTTLDLSKNELTELPDCIEDLYNLQVCNISHNKFVTFPKCLAFLGKLTQLDISYNLIGDLPNKFHSIRTLESLNAMGNKLCGVPEWIYTLPNLRELSLAYNQLKENYLKEEFFYNSQSLEILDMAGNKFDAASLKHVCSLRKLQSLTLGDFRIGLFKKPLDFHYLPEEFVGLSNLKNLSVINCRIQELPEDFGKLKKLEYLDLDENKLFELPASFCELKSLSRCSLSGNQIELLPANLCKLSELKQLIMANNKLHELPESFSQLTQLETLDITGNFISELPTALLHSPLLLVTGLEDNLADDQEWSSEKGSSTEEDLSDGWPSDKDEPGDVTEEEKLFTAADDLLPADEDWDKEIIESHPFGYETPSFDRQYVDPYICSQDYSRKTGMVVHNFDPSTSHAEPLCKTVSPRRVETEPEVEEGQFDDAD